MSKINLTLSDPIKAQEQAYAVMDLLKFATEKDKQKIKREVLFAAKKAQSNNNTFVASLYRKALKNMG